MHKVNTVNEKDSYILILGGWPWINSIKKYSDKFKDVNYIFFNYNRDLNTEQLVNYISRFIKFHKYKVTKYIWFSFGTYIWQFLIETIQSIKEVHYIWYLEDFKQLEDIYSKSIKSILQKYRDYKEIDNNTLDFYITENLLLCGVKKEDINITEEDRKESILQLEYESNKYYDFTINKKRVYKVKYNFYSWSFDKLTPYKNIQDFVNRYTYNCIYNLEHNIEVKDVWHSFSTFIDDILLKIK